MLVRRAFIRATVLTAGGISPLAMAAEVSQPSDPGIDEDAVVRKFTGASPVPSANVRLTLPAKFHNGYSVPLTAMVDCPMTDASHVRALHILAPLNPIIPVAIFKFTPANGRASISTRIRLAKPQTVLAIAEMNDGAWLMGRAHVVVETDGCA